MSHCIHSLASFGGLRRSVAAIAALCVLGIGLAAPAAVVTWTGSGADENWSTAGNWDAPLANGSDLMFTWPNQLISTHDAAAGVTSINSVTFNAWGMAVGGQPLAIGEKITNVYGTNSWNINTTFTGPSGGLIENTGTWSGDALTIGGTIDNNGNLLTVTGAASTIITLSNTVSGAGGLLTGGAGTVVLSGANTYTGATTITNGGVLSVAASEHLGDGSATNGLILAGGTLQTTAAFNTNRSVTLNAGANIVDVTVDTVTLDGAIGGVGGFTKVGVGTLQLAGNDANAFADTVVLNQGILELGKNGVNAIVGNIDTMVAPPILSDNHSLIRLLASDQIADTSNVTLRGVAGVGGGHINMGGFNETINDLTIDNNMTSASIAVMTGGGTLTVLGNLSSSGTSTGTGAGPFLALPSNYIDGGFLNLGAGVKTIDVTSAAPLTISSVITSGGINKTGGGTLALRGDNSATLVGTLTLGGGMVDFDAEDRLGAAANPIVLGGGGLQYGGASPLTLTRTLSGPGATFGVTNAAATFTLTDLTTTSPITKVGAGTLELAAASSVQGLVANRGVGLLNNASGNAISAGNVAINSSSSGPATVRLAASNQIHDGASVSLDANGSQLALFDVNNFSETIGGLTMTTTTNLTARVSLGATGVLTVNGDITLNNNRNASGNTAREVLITGTGVHGTPGIGGILDLGGQTRTITVNANHTQTNSGATIETVIQNGGIIKAGAQELRLMADNTFSGLLRIDAGILSAGSDASLGDIANSVVLNGGALGAAASFATDRTIVLNDVPGSGLAAATGVTFTVNSILSGTGSLTKTGPGTVVLGSANTYSGPTILKAGTLAVAAADRLGDNSATNGITLGGGGLRATASFATDRAVTLTTGTNTFDVDTGQTLDLSGIVDGSDGLVKTGWGTLRLSGSDANTYSGTTVVNRGVLELGKDGVVAVPGHLDSLVSPPGGGSNNPIIRLLAPEQIADTSNVTLRGISGIGGGQFDLGGFDETITDLTFVNNQGTGSIVVLAEGGTLNVLGNISVSGTSAGTSVGGLTQLKGNHIHGGMLNLGGVSPKTINVTSTAPLVISSTLQGAVDLVKQGNTSLYLNGEDSDFSGAWRIESGTVISEPTSGTGQAIGTGNITLAGGNLTLRDNGAGSGGVLAYGNNFVVQQDSTIDLNRASGVNTGNTFQFGTLSVEGWMLHVLGGNGYEAQFTGMASLPAWGSTTIDVVSTVVELSGGLEANNAYLTKTGDGTLRIKGTMSNLSGLTLVAGTLQIPNEPPGSGRDIAIPFGAGLGAGWVATQANFIDRITLDSAGVAALGVDTTFNPNFTGFTAGLRLGASDAATLTGTITPAGSTMLLGGGGGTLTLASVNAVSGAVDLNIGANGTLPATVVLAQPNNFSGTVTVIDGSTLGIGSAASLGTNTGPINIDNGTLQLTAGGDFAALATRTINIGAGGAGINTNGADASIGGLVNVSGSAAFTKSGVGRLTLAQANPNLSGPVVINGGALRVQAVGALGTSTAAMSIAQDAALELDMGAGTITIPNALSINGLGPAGTGAIRNVSGNNTISGTVTFSTAASVISDSGLLTLSSAIAGTGDVTIGGAGNITLSASTPNVGNINMTKVGSGTLTFSADPNQRGSFFVNEGLAIFNHGGSTDMNIFVNSGGTVRVAGGDNRLGDGYDVTLNGTGTLDMQASDTIQELLGDGIVTNNGTANRTLTIGHNNRSFTFAGSLQNGATNSIGLTHKSTGTITLTGVSTHTGNTTVNLGTLVLAEGGALRGATTVLLGTSTSRLEVGSNADTAYDADRLGPSTRIELQDGSQATFHGANDTVNATVEVMGSLYSNSGHNTVTINPVAGGQYELTASSLTRGNRGTFLFRGTGLGEAPAADTSRLLLTTAPATIGGAGVAGSQTLSIIPYAVGSQTIDGSGQSFVTLDPATGIRPLTNAEYAATLLGATQNNVSLAAPVAMTSHAAINSLRLATGGALTIADRRVLSLASGAVLDASATGGTISGGAIDFGAAEAVFHLGGSDAGVPITTTVTSGLRATGGLTLSAANNDSVLVLDGTSAVSGEISIQRGVLQLNNSAALNPFNRNNVRFAAEGSASTAKLRVYGASVEMGDLNLQTWGSVENGATTDSTVSFTIASGDRDVRLTLHDGGVGKLNLVKLGSNRVSFQEDSTFTGTATVKAGTLELKDGSDWDSLGGVFVEGGTFKWYNSGTNIADRLPDALTVTMRGGTIFGDNDGNSGQDFRERVGMLRLEAGVNDVRVDYHTSDRQSHVIFNPDDDPANVVERLAGAVARFSPGGNSGAVLGQNRRARIQFGPNTSDTATSSLLIKNGILHEGGIAYGVVGDDFATINATDLITSSATTMDHSIAAIGSGVATGAYQTSTDMSTWLATDNVKLSASVTLPLAGAATINSLILADGVDLDLNGQTLAVDAGGILAITSTAAGPNKTIGNGSITGGAFAGSEIVLRAGNDANTATAGNVVLAANVVDNGSFATSLTKWGGKDLTLSGVNSFTGDLNVTQGTLIANNVASLGGAVSGRTLRMATATLLDMSGATGSETLPFDSINITGIGLGTVRAAADQTLSFNGVIGGLGDLRFENSVNATLTGAATLNGQLIVGGSAATPVAAALPLSTFAFADADNVIGGSLQVGLNQRDATVTQTGGTLEVGFQQYRSELNIGYRTSDSVSTSTITNGVLDLTGLDNFKAQVYELRQGVITGGGGAGPAQGSLIIGNNSSITVGNVWLIGDSTSATNGTATSSVAFGSGSNVVHASTMIVGGRKGNGVATIASGGTLDLSGSWGGLADLYVARNNVSTGVLSTGSFDMTAGTLIADLNNLIVADKNGGGDQGAAGVFSLGAGGNVVNANSVTLGTMNGGNNNANAWARGTLNMAGGSFVVNNDLSLGLHSGTNATAQGTLNLTGGTMTVGGNIVKSATDRSSALVAVDGGTLDLTGGTITASQLSFRSGSVENVASSTLDGYNVTSGTARSNLANALVLRDVALPGNVALTNPTANVGGVLYEAAGGGSGGAIQGPVDMGGVSRTFTVEDSPVAARDLTVYGVVSGTGNLTKDGAGTLGLAVASTYAGDTNVLAGVLQTRTVTSGGTGAGNTTVSDGATLIADVIIQNSLVIGAGATVELTPSALHGDVWPTAETSVAAALSPTAYAGGGGGSAPVALGSASAVPEPATWVMLLMAAAAGLLVLRKRK